MELAKGLGEPDQDIGVRLEALLLAMDSQHILIISGTGDVIEPDESVAAIGSGGPLCPFGCPGAGGALSANPC